MHLRPLAWGKLSTQAFTRKSPEMDPKPNPPVRPHRGIYLLPNLLTTGAMFCGFYAIIAGISGYFTDAAIAVFIAGLLDGLDGRVARLTNTQSEFGMQYDSLSDLVSFGLAPALVAYTWTLSTLKEYGPFWGKVGWCAAFLYATCAALRLARFNTQVGVIDKRYFQGLASPAAAGLTMSFVWAASDMKMDGHHSFVQLLTPVLMIIAGLLMVSRVRYFSFKAWPLSDKVPFFWIPLAVLLITALALDTARVLFAIALLYVASGPGFTLWGLHRNRGRRESRTDERANE